MDEYNDEGNSASEADSQVDLENEGPDGEIVFDAKLVAAQSSISIYQCSFCGYQTPFRYILKRHYVGCQLKSGPISRLWECNVCKQIFTHHSHLKLHKNKAHFAESFRCDNCLFQTSDKDRFEEHFVNGQCVEEKVYQCDRCPFNSPVRMRLINHAKTHNPNRQGYMKKAHLCIYCNRKVGSHKLFKRHLMGHTAVDKTYCCEYCDYTTRQSTQLDEHKKVHQDMQEMVMLECSRCSLTFFSLTELKEHFAKKMCPTRESEGKNKRLHYKRGRPGKTPKGEEGLVFTCHLCPYAGRHLYDLTRHCRVVHRVNIFKRRKLSVLGEEKGYSCTRCNFISKYFSNLCRHIKTVHCLGSSGLPTLTKHSAIEEKYLFKNDSTYVCHECSLIIMDEYHLAYHKFLEHGLKDDLFKWCLQCSQCDYNTVSIKVCFNHGKTHVKTKGSAPVGFVKTCEGEYKGNFCIDYNKNKIFINNQISDSEDQAWLDAEENGGHETIEFNGKIDIMSFLEDKNMENEEELERLSNIIDWHVTEVDELNDPEEAQNRGFTDEPDDILQFYEDDDEQEVRDNGGEDFEEIVEEFDEVAEELQGIQEELHEIIEEEEENEEPPQEIQVTASKSPQTLTTDQEVITIEILDDENSTDQLIEYLEGGGDETPQSKEIDYGFVKIENPASEDENEERDEAVEAQDNTNTYNCSKCSSNVDDFAYLLPHVNSHAIEDNDPDLEVTFYEIRNGKYTAEYTIQPDCFRDAALDEEEQLDSSGSVRNRINTYQCQLCKKDLPRRKVDEHAYLHAEKLGDPNLEVAFSQFRQNKFVCIYKLKAPSNPGEKFYQLGEPSYKCQMCGIITYIRKTLQSHTNFHAREEKTPNLAVSYSEFRNDQKVATMIIKADQDGASQSSKRDRSPSPVREYDPELQVFNCISCNFKTNYQAALKKHNNLHWNSVKDKDYKARRWYSCSMCFFHCFDVETLKEHSAKHKKRPKFTSELIYVGKDSWFVK
ncbi:protein suppressor of hairy wing-like [Sitophilus oryzae]|uniref:Protein suppressor of hairy wing-like n=1 Tax=Sitophilus oryzae TaxID=7048 RepID=A0A6J2XR81_SITOR|nr:protein suppressor of hairy wing-like [Sitophilus oryzae]